MRSAAIRGPCAASFQSTPNTDRYPTHMTYPSLAADDGGRIAPHGRVSAGRLDPSS